MKIDLHLYPTLTESLFEQLDVNTSTLQFYYNRARKRRGIIETELEKILLENEDSSPIELADVRGYWGINHDDLIIKQALRIENPSILFGVDGIASKGSVIGVAVSWSSLSSLQKGVEHVGEIKYGDTRFNAKIELTFEKQQLRKKLNYKILMYIKEPDEVVETHFANKSGMYIGTLFEEEIILEGDASSFPIISIEEEDAPLWSLYCNWGSVYDRFEDSVRLKLNKNHKNYKYLNMEASHYNQYLFQQILVSVVVQIIHEAVQKNNMTLIEEAEDLPVGSVGSLIKYYLETYQINYQSLSAIYDSVNKHIWG